MLTFDSSSVLPQNLSEFKEPGGTSHPVVASIVETFHNARGVATVIHIKMGAGAQAAAPDGGSDAHSNHPVPERHKAHVCAESGGRVDSRGSPLSLYNLHRFWRRRRSPRTARCLRLNRLVFTLVCDKVELKWENVNKIYEIYH